MLLIKCGFLDYISNDIEFGVCFLLPLLVFLVEMPSSLGGTNIEQTQ
jgi:hypothetical protein